MDAYFRLANAIVLLAAKDYAHALKALRSNFRNREALAWKKECEHFFRSGWFEILTNLDAEALMESIQKEVYGKAVAV